jgi:hypothetical protein
MADVNAANQLVNDLTINSTYIWNCSRFLLDSSGGISRTVSQALGQLCKFGAVLGFAMLVLQILMDLVNQTIAHGVHPMQTLIKSLMRCLFAGILLLPFNYKILTVNMVGNPCNQLSEAISIASIDGMYVNEGYKGQLKSMCDKVGKSPEKKHSIFSSGFFEQLSIDFLASIIYQIALAFCFVLPFIQSALFTLAVFVGPICIPFMICDLTNTITKGWFSFLLSTAFMSVIGSITLYIIQLSHLMTKLDAAAGTAGSPIENSLVMIVYGFILCVLLAASFPISAFIFNAMGLASSATTAGSIINAASNFFNKGAGAMKSHQSSKNQGSMQNNLASMNQSLASSKEDVQLIKDKVDSIIASSGPGSGSGGGNQPVKHDAQSGEYSQSL